MWKQLQEEIRLVPILRVYHDVFWQRDEESLLRDECAILAKRLGIEPCKLSQPNIREHHGIAILFSTENECFASRT